MQSSSSWVLSLVLLLGALLTMLRILSRELGSSNPCSFPLPELVVPVLALTSLGLTHAIGRRCGARRFQKALPPWLVLFSSAIAAVTFALVVVDVTRRPCVRVEQWSPLLWFTFSCTWLLAVGLRRVGARLRDGDWSGDEHVERVIRLVQQRNADLEAARLRRRAQLVQEHLPAVAYRQAEGAEPLTCAICLDAVEEGAEVRVLPACSHTFHSACLGEWLARKPVCPLCREPFQAPDSPRPRPLLRQQGSRQLFEGMDVVHLARRGPEPDAAVARHPPAPGPELAPPEMADVAVVVVDARPPGQPDYAVDVADAVEPPPPDQLAAAAAELQAPLGLEAQHPDEGESAA